MNVGLDEDKVDDWLAASDTDITPPCQYTRIAGGRSNLTFAVVDRSGRRLVLRRPPAGTTQQSAHDVGREHRIIRALAPTRVPVPLPVGLCTDPAVTGAPFYVMDHVDGLVLSDAATVPDGFDHSARRRAALSLVDVLADLGEVDPAAAGLGDLGRTAEYLPRQLRRWSTQFDDARTREVPVINEVHRRLTANPPPQRRSAIVHGDYRLENCIFTPDGAVAAVLDWELCTLGDPLADLGWLLAYWVEPGENRPRTGGAPASTLNGFPDRAALVARYAERTGADVGHVDYYVAFSLWKLACICEGISARYRTGAMGSDLGDADRFADLVISLGDEALVLTDPAA